MTVRVGMIGAGGIAQLHIQALNKISAAKIVSVYDLNAEGAAATAEACGASVASSADELLNPELIDAVFICSPQFARGELEIIAVRRGIHLFVEKPLGLDLEVVHKKAEVIRESGVVHSVGYCLRYTDTVQAAKHFLLNRSVHLVQVFRFGGMHPARWWRQLETSGGHLVDAVTHQVDMVRYLLGEFESVQAQFSRVSMDEVDPDATIYDAGTMTFALQSGAVGTVTESCVSPYHGGSEIKLFGADFFLHLADNGMKLTIVDQDGTREMVSTMNPYEVQNNVFIEAVISKSEDSILSSYEDAAKSLAFTLAANKSGAERRLVSAG